MIINGEKSTSKNAFSMYYSAIDQIQSVFENKYKSSNIHFDYVVSKYYYIIYIVILIFRTNSILTSKMYGTVSATNLDLNSISNILGMINGLGIYFFIIAVILKNKRDIILFGTIETIWFLLGGSKLFIVFILVIYYFYK